MNFQGLMKKIAKKDAMNMNYSFLEKIARYYNLDINNINVIPFDQYPHIVEINTSIGSYILKELSYDRKKDYHSVFNILSDCSCVLMPIESIYEEYYTVDENKIYFLYEKIDEVEINPSAEHWADLISNVHMIGGDISGNCNTSFPEDLFSQCNEMLALSHKIMDPVEYEFLLTFLNLCNKNVFLEEKKVFCVNDPCKKNVLSINGVYKLIDMENSSSNYKEYDIQHLMWNMLPEYETKEELKSFWTSFKESYEKKTGLTINKDLLKSIFILDFVRSMAWLYLVSNDNSRKDQERQRIELNIFRSRIKDDLVVNLYNILGEY